MKVFKAYPFSFLGCCFHCWDGYFILSTTHGKLMICISSDGLFSEFLKFSTWIWASRNNEKDRFSWRWFKFRYVTKREWSGLNILISKSFFDKIVHSWFKSVRSEDLDYNASLEWRQFLSNLWREFFFRLNWFHELSPNLLIFKLKVRNYAWKSVGEHRKYFFSIFCSPSRKLHMRISTSNNSSREELPFIFSKQIWIDSFNKM